MKKDQTAGRAAYGDESMMLENQLCLPLYAAARRVVSGYTLFLKPLGITYTQYIVFLALWEYGDLSVGDLSEKLWLDSGTLTPLLKKLEQAGYVRRNRGTEDERVVFISLTEKGQALREEARPVPGCVAEKFPLSREEADQLYTLLYKVIRGIE